MNLVSIIKITSLALITSFYVSEASSATIKQKITPKNSTIAMRSCASPTCAVISQIPVGTTGAVIDTSSNWIKVRWDVYGEGWLINNDYYFNVLPDNLPNLSSVNISSSNNGQKEYFFGYATDDWNIRTIGMKVDGQQIFEESVSGKSINFSKYYFDPNNAKYGKGSGTYSVQIYAEDINGIEFKYFNITVGSTQVDNPPDINIVKNYTLKDGEKVNFSGSASDDYGLSQIEMHVNNPLGQSYLAFTRNTNGTYLNLSDYYFDSKGMYQGGIGQYVINFVIRDTNGNSASDIVYVNVKSYQDNSAKITEINNQINAIESISNANKSKALEHNSSLSDKNQKVATTLTDYKNNLKVQDDILSSGNAVNIEVIPNDKRLEECKNKSFYEKDRNVCTLTINNGSQTGSLKIVSQEIFIDYNALTDATYPATVYGETIVSEQLLGGRYGALSDGSSWSSHPVKTPIYIANNQQQLKAIVNFLVNNKSSWSIMITDSFREDIASIASAAQLSDYSVFDIERHKEELLENIEMTLSDLSLTPEQQQKLLIEATEAIVGLVPYVGNGKALLDSLSGTNLITQEKLSTGERFLNIAFIVVPQARLVKLKKVADSMGFDGEKIVKALVRNNRARGLAAATKLKENPSLIDAALSGCKDHDDHITNKGIGKGKTNARYPDVICKDSGYEVYIESKVGYTSNTKRIKEQLEKDFAILREDPNIKIYWAFSTSSVTGKNGYSKQMEESIPAELRGRLKFKIINKTLDK